MATDIKSSLLDFGLTEPEIAVYLASLELGPQPASLIAKKSGLKRGHTYNMLELLIRKGIVQEFIKDRVRYFSSRSPGTLLSIIEHKEEQIEIQKQKLMQIIPTLEKISNPLLVQPKVRFFQGVEGIKEIYEDTIRIPNQTIYAMGDFEYYFPEQHELGSSGPRASVAKGKGGESPTSRRGELVGETVGFPQNKQLNNWIWNYSTRRAKKNIWYIGIMNKSKMSDQAYRKRHEQKRKLKMLTGIYLPVEINIYGNKIALMSTYRDMVGVIVEDAPIAETLRNFHQAIWKFLPDYRK